MRSLRIARALALIAAWAIVVGLLQPLQAGQRSDRPNFLIIVADDLGWADVGYHGSPIPTPHLDRLCFHGVAAGSNRRTHPNASMGDPPCDHV